MTFWGLYLYSFIIPSVFIQFPSILKQADITPVFKRDFKSSKENYRAYSPGNIQVIGKAHL